jgi:hypothetical protein
MFSALNRQLILFLGLKLTLVIDDNLGFNYSQGTTTVNFYADHQAEKVSKYGPGTS